MGFGGSGMDWKAYLGGGNTLSDYTAGIVAQRKAEPPRFRPSRVAPASSRTSPGLSNIGNDFNASLQARANQIGVGPALQEQLQRSNELDTPALQQTLGTLGLSREAAEQQLADTYRYGGTFEDFARTIDLVSSLHAPGPNRGPDQGGHSQANPYVSPYGTRADPHAPTLAQMSTARDWTPNWMDLFARTDGSGAYRGRRFESGPVGTFMYRLTHPEGRLGLPDAEIEARGHAGQGARNLASGATPYTPRAEQQAAQLAQFYDYFGLPAGYRQTQADIEAFGAQRPREDQFPNTPQGRFDYLTASHEFSKAINRMSADQMREFYMNAARRGMSGAVMTDDGLRLDPLRMVAARQAGQVSDFERRLLAALGLSGTEGGTPAGTAAITPQSELVSGASGGSTDPLFQQLVGGGLIPESAWPAVEAALSGTAIAADNNPVAVAARMLGAAMGSDARLRSPWVSLLQQGQRPTPADLTMSEFTSLPTGFQQALAAVIGENVFPRWLAELAAFAPRGLSTRGLETGGLRLA